MAIGTDEVLVPPISPPAIKPISPASKKKITIVPIKNITPVKKVVSSTITTKPLSVVPPKYIYKPGPASPYTTGLGSQVKPDTEVSSFGSFSSEGISGNGEKTINGAGPLSGIPGYVWIGAAILLGYFLLK